MITGRKRCQNENLIPVVRKALQKGIRLIQIREKDLSLSELYSLSKKLKALCRSYRAQLLINSQLETALALNLDGVHLSQSGCSIREARLLLGPKKLIGASTHTLQEALKAEEEGAHFITFGPVFSTPSKWMFGKPVGLGELKKASKKLKIPVYALGGFSLSQLPEVKKVGAHGLAGIRTFIRDL